MKHKPVKSHKMYKTEGNLERTRRLCPRCGDSFLANHKNRFTCGKCKWTEFPKSG